MLVVIKFLDFICGYFDEFSMLYCIFFNVIRFTKTGCNFSLYKEIISFKSDLIKFSFIVTGMGWIFHKQTEFGLVSLELNQPNSHPYYCLHDYH